MAQASSSSAVEKELTKSQEGRRPFAVAVLDLTTSRPSGSWLPPSSSPKKEQIRNFRRDTAVEDVRAILDGELDKPAILNSISVQSVTRDEIVTPIEKGSIGEGKSQDFLQYFDVLVVTGQGLAPSEVERLSRELGPGCRAAMRRFVVSGGGFIGLGAGAFLGLSGHRSDSKSRWDRCRLLSAKSSSDKAVFGIYDLEEGAESLRTTTPVTAAPQVVSVSFTSEGKELLGLPSGSDSVYARYVSGPLFKPMTEEESQAEAAMTALPHLSNYNLGSGIVENVFSEACLPGVPRMLAYFKDGVKKKNGDRFAPESSVNSGAVVCGQCGQGRVMLFSPNFESTPLILEGSPVMGSPTDPAKQAILRRALVWAGEPCWTSKVMMQLKEMLKDETGNGSKKLLFGYKKPTQRAELPEPPPSETPPTQKGFSIEVQVHGASGLPEKPVVSNRMLVRVYGSVASVDPASRHQETGDATWAVDKSRNVVWENSSLMWLVKSKAQLPRKLVMCLHAVDNVLPALEHAGDVAIGWLEAVLPGVGQSEPINAPLRDLRGEATTTSISVTVSVKAFGTLFRDVGMWVQEGNEGNEDIPAAASSSTPPRPSARMLGSWVADHVEQKYAEQENAVLLQAYESKFKELQDMMQETSWNVVAKVGLVQTEGLLVRIGNLQEIISFFESDQEGLHKTLKAASSTSASQSSFSASGASALLKLASEQLDRLLAAKKMMDDLLNKKITISAKYMEKGFVKNEVSLELRERSRVRDMMHAIASCSLSIPAERQVITVGGNSVDNPDATLESSHIKNGTNVQVVSLSNEEKQVKKKADVLISNVSSVLRSSNPDFSNPKFVEGITVLKKARSYVAPICGGTWNEWSAPGQCQVCATNVDRGEKGLHCSNGGHRICWKCMADNMDWGKLIENDPQIFVTQELGLDEGNYALRRILCS